MAQILKIDLHLHTSEDRRDSIGYSAFELLEEAHRKGFDVISITNHDSLEFSEELRLYAHSLGLLLIPGVELTVEECHVLLLGELSGLKGGVNKLDDLYRIKGSRTMVIAAHPFFPGSFGIGEKILSYLDLFDALEFSHCYTRWLDFNRKTVKIAQDNGLPLVSFSDAHFLWQFGRAYTLLPCEKEIEDVFRAIRRAEATLIAPPLSSVEALRTWRWVMPSVMQRAFRKVVAAKPFRIYRTGRKVSRSAG